ncbi:MAG: sensor domain-containing diguanylate cyclase [Nitrospirae bacterium]|nr:sensor domain-containing diguanylate cyclase [Nitrospirota bacterium]MBI5695324.1 sensor domain-containing diguanylate cyclase [Nitrospirota bacterium]
MRKVLVFGCVAGFAGVYGDFFTRHGFELDIYSGVGGAGHKRTDAPILLVFSDGFGPAEEKGFAEALTLDRRLPVIYVAGGERLKGKGLKSAERKARYVLPSDFMKKDMLNALKGCSEVLLLREEVDRLAGDVRSKSDELSVVLEIGRVLTSSLELSKVLAKIMERIRGMVKAETWSVLLMDERNSDLVLEVVKGGLGDLRKKRIKLGEGIAGWAAEEMQARLVPDVTAEGHFRKNVDSVRGTATRSVMAVPIMSKDRLLGVMEMINKDGGAAGFSQADLQLVSRLVDQTAIAIERGEMYKRMADLVITDDLTKLFNMRYLDRTLEVEIERAMRYNLSCSLIFMDIDFFKKVNDSYGHLVGSKLLVEVSQLLLRGLRRVDIVARYGGDEFVLVLPQTDVDAAKAIAERLRRSMEKHIFMKSENLSLKLTASFGIASYPDHADTKEDLMRLADEAMYQVKYHTRNAVYVVGSK